MRKPFDRQLRVRHAQQWRVSSHIELNVCILAAAEMADIKLLRLPRQQTFFDLLGKTVGIARSFERFLRHNRGRLMMSVTVPRGARKSRAQHVGTKHSDDADHVGQRNLMSSPLLERLFRSLREAKIRYAREALLDSVVLIRGQKLQCSQHSELV